MKKVTNVAWLIVIVLTLALMLSGCGNESEAPPTSTPLVLPTAVTAATPEPTEDATPEPALEGEPTAAPEPVEEEWTTQVDPDTGEEYLSPPPEVEAQIREAFEAVLACHFIEDMPDEEAVQYDREAILERARPVATPEVIDQFCAGLVLGYEEGMLHTVFLSGDLGIENPSRCEDRYICTLKQEVPASERFSGLLIFDPPEYFNCSGTLIDDELGDMCFTRKKPNGTRNVLLIATIENENGVWNVTDLSEVLQ